MGQPPVLVAGGYVNPGQPAKLIVLHVPEFVQTVKLNSSAFATDDWVEATVSGTGPDRVATATAPIGPNVEPGEHPVTGDLGYNWRPPFKLVVEPAFDGTITATLTPRDDKGLMDLKVELISRNTAWADARSPVNQGDGETWFGLVFTHGDPAAHANVVTTDVQPGTYPVEVRQQFHGGHTEVLRGTVTLPGPNVLPGKPQFTIPYRVNLAQLGDGDTIVHKVPFGKDHEQTNTRYSVLINRRTIDPTTGQPVKPTAEEAAELALLEPYHVQPFTDHVELHTRNPHKLRGNSRFKLIMKVTVFPVADDDGAGYSDDETELAEGELINA